MTVATRTTNVFYLGVYLGVSDASTIEVNTCGVWKVRNPFNTYAE